MQLGQAGRNKSKHWPNDLSLTNNYDK